MALFPDNISNFTISAQKRNVAIAEITLFSLILIVQFFTRFIQERHYWHHKKRRSNARCFLYSWWGMIGILAQLRIVGSALMISHPKPSQSMLIAETCLQGVGLSPLLFEVSLILLRTGQSGQTGPGNSRHPKYLRFMLHFFRFPVVVSILLALVGGIINIRGCAIAGTVGFILTFVFVCCLVIGMAATSRSTLSATGYQSVLVVLSTLPFLTGRIAYFVLAEYGPQKYSPVIGDASVMAGMGLLMEIFIAVLLLVSRAVAEPFRVADFIMIDAEDN
ncbi:hypothetical protein ARAM_002544 [Aspergillus rambellii]|uniref:DUF7702 domain-containing protein n=3 Tax=Aspergillus subgen. Nidulantes TaxID=2720870 RepID=A0A0F8V4J4_9EURO|nr:hypothetical protein AOCH_001380 [Aspergillus ochraceoroseus]KKK26658.1 hypothetical protein ARAM_002544 [Aspergillus rambellii]